MTIDMENSDNDVARRILGELYRTRPTKLDYESLSKAVQIELPIVQTVVDSLLGLQLLMKNVEGSRVLFSITGKGIDLIQTGEVEKIFPSESKRSEQEIRQDIMKILLNHHKYNPDIGMPREELYKWLNLTYPEFQRNIIFLSDNNYIEQKTSSIQVDKTTYLKHQVKITTQGIEFLEGSLQQLKKHIIYVDGSYKKDKGGSIAWYNETTGQIFQANSDCKDSFRCEYVTIIHALENAKDIKQGDVIQIRSDNETVVRQLNHDYAINDDDIREYTKTIWSINERFGNSISFVWIPRGENKAGKMLGS